MNKHLLTIVGVIALLGFGRTPTRAGEDGHFVLGGPRLTIGDPAPPLSVEAFVRGEAISSFKPGTTYVLEFWKTGCPPCRAAIPHLNQLQKQYPAVVFLSVGVYTSTSENIAYVKRSKDQMQYRVAVDRVPARQDPSTHGAMVRGWLEPADQVGVPACFIVGPDGRIAWIGHPMSLADPRSGSPLANITLGKWDMQAAAAQLAAATAPRQRPRMDQLNSIERDALHAIQVKAGRVGFDIRDNQVTGIDLDSRLLNDEILGGLIPSLKQFKKLERLGLGNAAIGDKTLSGIGQLAGLKMLDLGFTQVSDQGLGHLSSLTDLWVLNLPGTGVNGSGLTELTSLKKLETIDLTGAPVSTKGMKAIRQLPNLFVLQLANTALTDESLAELKGGTQLRGVDLSGTLVSDSGLQALSGMTLGSLSLSGTRVTGTGLQYPKDLVGLLKLSSTTVNDTGLQELKRFPHLSRLTLDSTQVTDAALSHLTGNRGLRSLSLVDTKVTDAGLIHLRNAMGLEVLELGGTQVTDDAFNELKRFPALTFLDLARTRVTNATVQRFQSTRSELLIAN